MKTKINLAGIMMENPVMTASGTFGYGKEYSQFYNLNGLGAIVTKSVTLEPRQGNPPPRITETTAGMLNSIGLQNPGIDVFLKEAIPFLGQYEIPIIVSISENCIENFVEVAKNLSIERVNGLEINVSCPNVEGMAFGTDARATYDVIRAVRENTDKPLIVKLTPNVTDIVKIAEAAYLAGGDALSMINTLLGMAIDIKTKKPKIHGNGKYMGGLSGPCIKPVGVRCVRQIYKSEIPLPIVGIGGIINGEDAIEYMLAGATAVGIGTANFLNPMTPIKVIKGIEDYMREYKVEDINNLIGQMIEI
jgi:dihydroorotate dehydrogenase (NAD+) catalytic subunit